MYMCMNFLTSDGFILIYMDILLQLYTIIHLFIRILKTVLDTLLTFKFKEHLLGFNFY